MDKDTHPFIFVQIVNSAPIIVHKWESERKFNKYQNENDDKDRGLYEPLSNRRRRRYFKRFVHFIHFPILERYQKRIINAKYLFKSI